MSIILAEYKMMLIFAVIALALALALVSIAVILSTGEVYPEKLSAYECGFNPFGDARQEFDVRFYTTAILFVIFDVEVALLLPLSDFLRIALPCDFISVFGFITLLFIALWYEMYCDTLNWE